MVDGDLENLTKFFKESSVTSSHAESIARICIAGNMTTAQACKDYFLGVVGLQDATQGLEFFTNLCKGFAPELNIPAAMCIILGGAMYSFFRPLSAPQEQREHGDGLNGGAASQQSTGSKLTCL